MEVPLDAIFDAFGVPATVTPPGGEAVDTTGAWVLPSTEDAPSTFSVQRREPRLVMALQRAEVGQVPKGTVIDAPPPPGDPDAEAESYTVDGFDKVEADILRVVLVPTPE